MFKIFAVGLMLSNRRVMDELEVYFFHLVNPGCGSGFANESMTGKINKGDVGGSRPCSCVPKGVEMSDLEYLQAINRVDLALVALKSYDLSHDTQLWDYIHGRYRYGMNIVQLMCEFRVCKQTCFNWQNQALSFISAEIS